MITKDSVPFVVALEIVATTVSLPSYVLSTIVVTLKSTEVCPAGIVTYDPFASEDKSDTV